MNPESLIRIRISNYKYKDDLTDIEDCQCSELPLCEEDEAKRKEEDAEYDKRMTKFYDKMDHLYEFFEQMIITGEYDHDELEYKIGDIRNYILHKLKM